MPRASAKTWPTHHHDPRVHALVRLVRGCKSTRGTDRIAKRSAPIQYLTVGRLTATAIGPTLHCNRHNIFSQGAKLCLTHLRMNCTLRIIELKSFRADWQEQQHYRGIGAQRA